MEVKITLKIKDISIELNKEELDELYEVIKALKGETYIPYPYPMPIIEPYPQPYYYQPCITIS